MPDPNTPVGPSHRCTVQQVDWSRLLRTPHLFRAIPLASAPQRILLGTAMIAILMGSGHLWDAMTGQTAFSDTVRLVSDLFRDVARSAIQLDPVKSLCEAHLIPFRAIDQAWRQDKFFITLFGFWFLMLWYIGGCTISRSAATEFAIEQTTRWTHGLAFSLKRWIPLTATVVLPAVLTGLGVGMLTLGGYLLGIPWLNVAVAATLYGLALFGSFLLACLILLFAIAQPLFVPAVAVESADTPDALSRAFSYVKNRPVHYLLYTLVLSFQGIVGYLIVILLATTTLQLIATGLDMAGHSELSRLVGTNMFLDRPAIWDHSGLGEVPSSHWTARIINVWNTLVVALVCGWVVSYVFSARVALYFVMRNAVDRQDMHELWLPGLIEGTMAPDRAVRPPGTT